MDGCLTRGRHLGRGWRLKAANKTNGLLQPAKSKPTVRQKKKKVQPKNGSGISRNVPDKSFLGKRKNAVNNVMDGAQQEALESHIKISPLKKRKLEGINVVTPSANEDKKTPVEVREEEKEITRLGKSSIKKAYVSLSSSKMEKEIMNKMIIEMDEVKDSPNIGHSEKILELERIIDKLKSEKVTLQVENKSKNEALNSANKEKEKYKEKCVSEAQKFTEMIDKLLSEREALQAEIRNKDTFLNLVYKDKEEVSLKLKDASQEIELKVTDCTKLQEENNSLKIRLEAAEHEKEDLVKRMALDPTDYVELGKVNELVVPSPTQQATFSQESSLQQVEPPISVEQQIQEIEQPLLDDHRRNLIGQGKEFVVLSSYEGADGIVRVNDAIPEVGDDEEDSDEEMQKMFVEEIIEMMEEAKNSGKEVLSLKTQYMQLHEAFTSSIPAKIDLCKTSLNEAFRKFYGVTDLDEVETIGSNETTRASGIEAKEVFSEKLPTSIGNESPPKIAGHVLGIENDFQEKSLTTHESRIEDGYTISEKLPTSISEKSPTLISQLESSPQIVITNVREIENEKFQNQPSITHEFEIQEEHEPSITDQSSITHQFGNDEMENEKIKKQSSITRESGIKGVKLISDSRLENVNIGDATGSGEGEGREHGNDKRSIRNELFSESDSDN